MSLPLPPLLLALLLVAAAPAVQAQSESPSPEATAGARPRSCGAEGRRVGVLSLSFAPRLDVAGGRSRDALLRHDLSARRTAPAGLGRCPDPQHPPWRGDGTARPAGLGGAAARDGLPRPAPQRGGAGDRRRRLAGGLAAVRLPGTVGQQSRRGAAAAGGAGRERPAIWPRGSGGCRSSRRGVRWVKARSNRPGISWRREAPACGTAPAVPVPSTARWASAPSRTPYPTACSTSAAGDSRLFGEIVAASVGPADLNPTRRN